VDLAAGRVRGVIVEPARLAPGPASPEAVAHRLVPSGLSEATRDTLRREAAGADGVKLAGLILGSPEFQRR
jgi:hypothetical protein